MNEMLMTDVRKKFANARELCAGMSDEIYALTDYLAAVTNDSLNPGGIVMTLVCVMDDLEKKRCCPATGVEFPEYLATHSIQVRAQMPYILQVMDAIAEEDFAEAVRVECKKVFDWEISKRVDVSSKVSEHENVNVAVNWWAEAIQHPKMDDGGDGLARLMMMFGGDTSRRQLTEAELQTFRERLADGVMHYMEHFGRVTLSVDYSPGQILEEAGSAIGLGQFDFPCKTTMRISETEVTVSVGHCAPEQTIWSAN